MPDDEVIYLTPKGYDKLQDELTQLTTVRRLEIANRIRDSKDHGEFADDNTELEEIKFEQALVESRIAELKDLLGVAQKLATKDIPVEKVGVGSVVVIDNINTKDDEFEVRIVTPFEADPDEGNVSIESPLGRALLGQKPGDKVSISVPAGNLSYEIKQIKKK
jgi:transcription elongation factor GreA